MGKLGMEHVVSTQRLEAVWESEEMQRLVSRAGESRNKMRRCPDEKEI